MTRFSRHLIREVLPLYGAGLVVLVILLLGSFLLGALADILARGVPPSLVAQFLLFKLPAAAGFGIPLALLFASILGLTRLTQDGEIRASLLLGLSPRRFVLPMLTLGLAVSALSFINNEAVIPWSEQRALEVQKDIFLRSPNTLLQEGSFFTDALGRNILIEALEPDGRLGRNLQQIRFLVFRRSALVLDFAAESAMLPIRGLSASAGGVTDLTYLPLRALLARLRNDPGRPKPAEWTALHRKIAEPLAATAFTLFALAITLSTFRRNAPLGLVAVLFLTFLYYATWSVTRLLGAQGTLPGWLAGWIPVLLYAVAGGTLLILAWRR